MPLNTMGKTNQNWGVCGFTSSLYALYSRGDDQEKKDLTKGADSYIRMAAEIKSYFKFLEADGAAKLLSDISSFTRSFEGYEGFSIADYNRKVDAIPKMKGGKLGDFSVGMPPHCVVDYLKRVCNFRNAAQVDLGSTKDELILGVDDPEGKMKMYSGLCHYLYQKGGKIYSWGGVFADVEAAGKSVDCSGWKICYKISPNG